METMQSLQTIKDNPDNVCYICLSGQNELAPFCNPKESKDWVKPCSCSLIAHRKCFLSWVSSLDLQKRRDQQNRYQDQEIQQPEQQSQTNNSNQIFRYSIQHLFLGIPLIRKSETINILVDCPQCKRGICFKTPNSTVLNLRSTLDTSISNIMKVGITSTIITSSIGSLTLGLLLGLGSAGISIMDKIAPESVVLSLFDINSSIFMSSIRTAVDNNLIPPAKYFSFATCVPFHVVFLRTTNLLTSPAEFASLCVLPSLIYSGWDNLLATPAKQFLFATIPAKYLYKLFYNLTFNRIYYKWCKQVQPCFIADRLSLKELDRIEKENEEEYELDEETSNKNSKPEESIYDNKRIDLSHLLKRLFNFKLDGIKFSRFRRELISCFKFDYSKVFQSKHFYLFIATTLLWPSSGQLFGKLLDKIPVVHQFIGTLINTPNEGIFLRNLIGCLSVAILKDFANLYFNYKKFKQLKYIDVVPGGQDPELVRTAELNIASN